MSTLENRYQADFNEDDTFQFTSTGRKGTFLIEGAFVLPFSDAPNYYSFGFGVKKPGEEAPDDKYMIGNGDRSKIIATVAHEILEFVKKPGNEDVYLHFSGSDRRRTVFYKKLIVDHWNEIAANDIIVFGGLGPPEVGKIVPFQKSVDYDYFILRNK